MRKVTKPNYPDYGFKSDRDLHIFNVYNDPDFVEDFTKRFDAGDLNSGGYQELSDKWLITVDDVVFYKIGAYKTEPNTDEDIWVHYDDIQQQFSIILGLNTSKETLDKAWDSIQKKKAGLQVTKKRRRPADDPQLVYAIFKQRMAGISFADIFSKYQKGTLPGYDGPTNNYSSQDNFEDYYREHKPKAGG